MPFMRNKYSLLRFLFFTVVMLYFSHVFSQGNTQAECDRMIESGIKALNKNELTRSLETLSQVRNLAQKNGWSKQEFLALNSLGNVYYRVSEYGEALNFFLQAYTLALRELKPQDEITVLNNIAIIYSEEKKYAQADDYFKRVYKIADYTKNFVPKGVAAINLGNLAILTEDYKLARTYFDEALVLLAKDRNLFTAQVGLANCYLFDGNVSAARELALKLLSSPDKLNFYRIDVTLMTIIAESYLKEGKLEMASVYISKAFDKEPNLEGKIKLFKLLTEINIQNGTLKRALQYKDSVFTTTAMLNEKKNQRLYENSKVKFELQNYKNKATLNEAKLMSERKIFYSALLFIVIILGLVIWLVRNVSLKHKQKKLIAERNEQILALELENEKRELLLLEKHFNETKTVALLQEEKLRNEVELKNRKLSAKALYLAGRNEIIEEILTELSGLPQVAKDKSLLTHMQSLKNQIKADNEWENFIKHFEEVNQGFLNKLQTKHPSLNTNDIRYICYRYMNLSTKEIASMLNITQDSCRKRKERVYSKMSLPTDANLYDYLRSL